MVFSAFLASTDVGIAIPSTRRIATLDEAWCLNLNTKLSGVVAKSVNRLVDVVPYELEIGAPGPNISYILPHRSPDVFYVGTAVDPSSCAVRCNARVFKDKRIGALRIS